MVNLLYKCSVQVLEFEDSNLHSSVQSSAHHPSVQHIQQKTRSVLQWNHTSVQIQIATSGSVIRQLKMSACQYDDVNKHSIPFQKGQGFNQPHRL